MAKFKMKESKEILKYIYQEDLYIIDEPEKSTVFHQAESKEVTEFDIGEKEPTVVQEIKPVAFLGNNEKGILILVNDCNNEFLNQIEMQFLMTIIEGGLKLTKVDFALINLAKYSYSQVLDEMQYNYIISFDETQKSNTRYQVIDKDRKKILFAENLTAIEADKEKKKLLWKTLKSMFNI